MKLKKHLNLQSFLWVALLLALFGSLSHLSAVFASMDNNPLLGWVQAIAIDIGLVSLSYYLRRQKIAGEKITHVWLGIVLFTAISIYGNLAYGILSFTGQLPPWIIMLRPVVLSASLPVLVLYLAEMLAKIDKEKLDEATASATTKKAELARAKNPEPTQAKNPEPPRKETSTKQDKIAARQKQVLTLAEQKLSNKEIADKIGVSLGTIKNDQKEIKGENNGL